MMLTIHGLPRTTKYQDVKLLLRQQCNIIDYILDNMVTDTDGLKKVRIGLSDDRDGQQLIKCLDGYRTAGHVLKVLPVGKSTDTQGPNYGSYNQPRDSYPQNNYGDTVPAQRPGPWDNSQWQPNQQIDQNNYYQGQANTSYVTQSQPQREVFSQAPQSRMPQDQTYGYPQKSQPEHNMHQHRVQEARSHVLRAVEIVDSPQNRIPTQNRYPTSGQGYGATEKPITIMKDNFQGPTQYNVRPQETNYQGPTQPTPSPWAQQQPKPTFGERKFPVNEKRQVMLNSSDTMARDYKDTEYPPRGGMQHARTDSPNIRRSSPMGRRISPSGRNTSGARLSPSGRRLSPSGRNISSSGAPIPPPGRRHSPPARNISSTGARLSPPGRNPLRHSPGRRMSPGRNIPLSNRISPGRRVSPSGRRFSPSGRRISPVRKNSPSGRKISPGRRISPSTRRISPFGRRVSPSGRRISPPGRKMSPSGRRASPNHGMSHFTRSMSLESKTSSPGRKMSPPGRKMSPQRTLNRRMSPGERRMAPARRVSPRRMSPPARRGRESSVRQTRFSPNRRIDKIEDKYGAASASKPVRPTYDAAPTQNQAGYSSGYVQYPIAGARQPDRHESPWQDKPAFPGAMKKDDDRSRGEFESARALIARAMREQGEVKGLGRRSHSPLRRSRSRSRSVGRERYNRQSRSPSSQRRSWAFEKRSSPAPLSRTAPPPPAWHDTLETRDARDTRDVRDTHDTPQHYANKRALDVPRQPGQGPVWDRTRYDKEEPRRDDIRPDDRRFLNKEVRLDKELPMSKPIPHSARRELSPRRGFEEVPNFSAQVRVPKFSPREDFRRPEVEPHRPENVFNDKPFFERSDPSDRQRPFDRDVRPDDIPPRRPDVRGDYRKPLLILDEEIENVHKRALEFSRKTEEFKREKRQENEEFKREKRHENEEFKREKRHESERHREFDKYEPRGSRERVDERREREVEDKSRLERKNEFERQAFYLSKKRNKAVEEITEKILAKHSLGTDSTMAKRIIDELKETISRLVTDMFGNDDVSFIEVIIKFNAKYGEKQLKKIFEDVVSRFPGSSRILKRSAPETTSAPPAKRHSPKPPVKQDVVESTNVQQIPSRSRYIQTSASHEDYGPPAKIPRTSGNRTLKEPPVKRPSDTEHKKVFVIKKSISEKPTVKLSASNDPEAQGEGHYSLNPLMTRVLNAHLQDIMIKVWQALPDNAPTDAEQLVVDKFRNEIGDDFRNILGLNVTKRILNIHNPLYVKIQFSTRPDRDSLKAFLVNYNITALKRCSDTDKNLFAAQVKDIVDFDRICCARHLKCGNAKVIVTPCYKFTQCPVKIKTNFVEVADQKSDENKQETNKLDTSDTVKKEDMEAKSLVKDVPPVSETEPKKSAAKVGTVAKSEVKVLQPVSKTKPNKAVVKDDKDTKTQTKVVQPVIKTEPTKVTVKAGTETKSQVKVVQPVSKTEQTEAPIKAVVPKTEPLVKDLQTSNTTKTDPKTNTDVVNTKNTNKVNKKEQIKPTIENHKKSEVIKEKPKVISTNNLNSNKTTKTVSKSEVKANKNINQEVPENIDEGEEMDDAEILKLLSGGIVLDECGSDED